MSHSVTHAHLRNYCTATKKLSFFPLES